MPIRRTRTNARKLSSASQPSQVTTAYKSRAKSVSKNQIQPRFPVVRTKGTRGKGQDVWCVCKGPDDGTPMVTCENCKDWFHFSCINLSEREAEEIQLYVCDSCRQTTGQTTVYEWEGPDAIELVTGEVAVQSRAGTGESAAQRQRSSKTRSLSVVTADDVGNDEEDEDEDENEDAASGDDYKDEQGDDVVVRRGKVTKRITSSDEEVDDDKSGSPATPLRRTQLKRKRGKDAQTQRKRPRKPTSEVDDDGYDGGSGDEKLKKKGTHKGSGTKHDSTMDATRTYCLGKLRDVLLPIFVQFAKTVEVASNNQPENVEQKAELDDAEKHKAEENGTLYVSELENCLFETYGELDKQGGKTAGVKYKGRFMMLTYNLSQPDRHHLRQMIGTHNLPAVDLSKMSSGDLANEQTKLQIEAANRESLEHSILTQRPVFARAKITHKGEEIIEDLEGADIGGQLREDEQRELERTKSIRERAMSTTTSTSFQGPQDILAQQHNVASQKAAQAQAQRMASATVPLHLPEIPQEPAFRFDDLIAIDLPDSPSERVSQLPDISVKPPHTSSPKDEKSITTEGPPQSDTTISTTSYPTSFDLSSVWTDAGSESMPQKSSESAIVPVRTENGPDPGSIHLDLGTAAMDEDFDIFLNEKEPAPNEPQLSNIQVEQAIFEALPVVWNGIIIMPDAGKAPAVHARQVGGRPMEPASPQWSVLFAQHPPNQLRVEGRVPVKESAKYMTQNRLNVTRELLTVALTPVADRTDYDDVISFLINRNRHAVILPWGVNPGPEAPGKELYIIPLLPHEPLPDYVELLDLVKFPRNRQEKMLLGVFILNKGKFFAPQLPPNPLPVPAVLPLQNQSHIPAPPPPPPAPESSSLQPNTSISPEIVSKLTAEQIGSLFQTVMGSGGLPSIATTQPVVPGSQPAVFPPSLPAPLATLLPPYPSASVAPYTFSPTAQSPIQYPPPPPPPQVPPIQYNYPSLDSQPIRSASPQGQEYRRGSSYGNSYNQSGRGEHDRARGRGRPLGDGEYDRPRDSGWAGRGRGRGARIQKPW